MKKISVVFLLVMMSGKINCSQAAEKTKPSLPEIVSTTRLSNGDLRIEYKDGTYSTEFASVKWESSKK